MSLVFLNVQNRESNITVSSPPNISVLLNAPCVRTDPSSSDLSFEDSPYSTCSISGINIDTLSMKNAKERQLKALASSDTNPNASIKALFKEEIVVEDNLIAESAYRIQTWWRRILRRRRLAENAVRRLLAEQKNRMLNMCIAKESNTPLLNRTRRCPRVAPVFMKRVKDLEPLAGNCSETTSWSSSIALKERKISSSENGRNEPIEPSYSSLLEEQGSKPSGKESKTADLLQEIMADLEKLSAVQSELVLHNGKRLDEHAKSSESLRKISQLLKGVQTKSKTEKGLDGSRFAIDQVRTSIKSLSEVTHHPSNGCPLSVAPNADFNCQLGRDSILTPRQLCPLRHDSLVHLPPSGKEIVTVAGDIISDVQDNSKFPMFYEDNSGESPLPYQDSYIGQFERELSEQRRCIEKQHANELEQALQDCQKRLREEYEAKLEKNYHLIEQLIAEKKELMGQCDKLVSDMRQLSEKGLAKQKLMEEQHKVELKKAEAKVAAGEKIKRERWEAVKTKSIKEQATKAVERDIQRMMTDHKAEIEEVKRYFKEQLEAADLRASEQYLQKIEEFRAKSCKECEDICAQERKLVAERYEALIEEERQVWDNLRKKLIKEADEEKERVMAQSARERAEFEEQISRLKNNLTEASQKQLHEMERVEKKMREEHENDLLKLQKRLEGEKADIEEAVRTQLQMEFQVREREIADRLRKERDRQLEAAIQRLEEESNLFRDEIETSAQERIKRLKEKHQKDVEELESAECQAKEKYNQIKARCMELEGEMSCQTVRITQLTEELRQVRAKNDQLNGEREQLREVLIREIEEEMAAVRASATRAQCEVAETKAQAVSTVARLQAELNETKRDAAEELESLHQKIKEAIVKKDANIAELIRRHEKEVRDLQARLNMQGIGNSNNASKVDGESGAAGLRPNTLGVAKRGAARTRAAALRGR